MKQINIYYKENIPLVFKYNILISCRDSRHFTQRKIIVTFTEFSKYVKIYFIQFDLRTNVILYCFFTGIFCFKKKTVSSFFLTCIPPCKYGNHMLGLFKVH